jgi:hypothetical protein
VVVVGRDLNKNPPDFWPKSGGFFDDFIMRSVRLQNPADFFYHFIMRSVRFCKIRRIS